jgi:hypothetical protein
MFRWKTKDLHSGKQVAVNVVVTGAEIVAAIAETMTVVVIVVETVVATEAAVTVVETVVAIEATANAVATEIVGEEDKYLIYSTIFLRGLQ